MPTAKRPSTKPTRPPAKPTTTPSDIMDDQLARYRSMRDFSLTEEPAGTAPPSKRRPSGLPFVIQKHAASHLHYDFRLGWNGVLKSWACARGPSYVPGDRRLAVQVEDHPMEYGGFEGIIPKGQYGGGTVMVWDQGTWEPQPGHPDIAAGLRSGSLKFILHGTRMKGRWTLVRMGGKAAREKKPNWLLIKEHDEFEAGETAQPITEAQPDSVVTGRSLAQIAASEDHVWNSKDTASPKGKAWFRNDTKPSDPRNTAPDFAHDLAKTPREKLPDFLAPQLASEAASVPGADGWVHELKLDGYRIQARKLGNDVQLRTRSGLDWTHRMRPIARAIAGLAVESALLDGEVVVLNPDGTTSFADLQAAFQADSEKSGPKKDLLYFAFDCLHANGHRLRGLPLLERKAILAKLLHGSDPAVRLGEHLTADGATVFRHACALHAEGIVSKRAASPYVSGRSSTWVKSKCIHEQEFVIGGFTLPAKGRAGLPAIGSLLLGFYDSRKKLVYAGRTGTGFTQQIHRLLRTQLESLRSQSPPFAALPAEARRGAIWVEPTLVAQVRFATWTAEHLLRQASFQGLREDKTPTEVRLEPATAKPATAKPATTRQTTAKPRPPAKSRATLGVASTAAPTVASSSKSPVSANSGTQQQPHAPVRLTHPDKVLDADSGLTKQQLADFYWAIAPHLLPHIAGRPLSLVRCPQGAAQPCFFQKHTTTMLPPGIESVDVPDKKTGKPEPYITLSTPEALAGLAQMSVLELHPWGSCNADLEHPDRLIIDLDPDASISWATLAAAAKEVRKRFKQLGLESFLKSTGGKGLHIVVPVQPSLDWAAAKKFTHDFVQSLAASDPALYLTKMSKAARKDRIYLDYLRNERGATAVAAFSPRARAGSPVSLPLAWTELSQPERPTFHIYDFATWKHRLARDPWKTMSRLHQTI